MPIKVERHSIVPKPFLNAKRLDGKNELCSNHHLRLVLNICSNILYNAEERTIGRKEVLLFNLEIGITLYDFQINGTWLVIKILFKVASKKLRALECRCLNIIGEILLRLEAVERHEDIAYLSSIMVKGLINTRKRGSWEWKERKKCNLRKLISYNNYIPYYNFSLETTLWKILYIKQYL